MLEVYKTAMTPFITGFKAVGGLLGFDVEASEDPKSPAVKAPTANTAAIKTTNATIAQAATEIRSIVVAQLRDTGIQETANELAKIAGNLKNMKVEVVADVNMDGNKVGQLVADRMMQ